MSLNLSELMVAVKLNANRNVVGVLRGFDQFMNLVLDNTLEVNGNDTTEIGMVVSVPTSVSLSSFSIDTQFATMVGSCIFASTGFLYILICIILIVIELNYCLPLYNISLHLSMQVIRGNSVVMIEALEAVR